jgi:hypothetical protein
MVIVTFGWEVRGLQMNGTTSAVNFNVSTPCDKAEVNCFPGSIVSFSGSEGLNVQRFSSFRQQMEILSQAAGDIGPLASAIHDGSGLNIAWWVHCVVKAVEL